MNIKTLIVAGLVAFTISGSAIASQHVEYMSAGNGYETEVFIATYTSGIESANWAGCLAMQKSADSRGDAPGTCKNVSEVSAGITFYDKHAPSGAIATYTVVFDGERRNTQERIICEAMIANAEKSGRSTSCAFTGPR